ncbi:MAG: glycosyl hydrolase [Verrucomicrobiota bacterium]
MKRDILREIKNPGSEYRGAPFWSWNGKLEPEELRRQIRIMHKMGLGGFFMHSRVGLATPYLSEEWFDCVRACIDEAKKLGMKAWLYDEDRWPSGFAGGIVTRNPAYRGRRLVFEISRTLSKKNIDSSVIGVWSGQVDGNSVNNLKRLGRNPKKTTLKKDEQYLIFKVKFNECSERFNGFTYLDTLNPEAVREFIRVTHDAYKEKIGEDFGKTVPGIFTDEPMYGWLRLNGESVPWTEAIPGAFRQKYGYDLTHYLPELFFHVEGRRFSTARYNYVDCITSLFVEAFAKQIGEWCQKEGILFTGHVMAEDTPASQVSAVGDCMPFYEHMQAPGMDLLTERRRNYDTAKQVSSVANQFNRRWRLTETYGCTGWDFPFEGHKVHGDWQTALGINFRCQHLSYYTMEGQAKRDYPASISYQSPWWNSYNIVEDYFARLNVFMSRGREVRDLLVIHPVESVWPYAGPDDWELMPEVQAVNSMLRKVRDKLLEAHLDFDYGSESLLERYGKISSKLGRPELVVKNARYSTVLVPPLSTIRSSVLKLLERFKKAGGKVVCVESPPQYVDASRSDKAEKVLRSCVMTQKADDTMTSELEKTCRTVSITDGNGEEIPQALYCLREDTDSYYLFISNTGLDGPAESLQKDKRSPRARQRVAGFDQVYVKLMKEYKGAPLEVNLDTGITEASRQINKNKTPCVETSLPRLGSRLFVFPKQKDVKHKKRLSFQTRRTRKLSGKWAYALSDPNCLVMDKPEHRIGSGGWRAAADILKIDHSLRKKIGEPLRSGRMVQPWIEDKSGSLKSEVVHLRYSIDVRNVPRSVMSLAVEQPDCYNILFNGHELTPDMDSGWWVDQSLRLLKIDPSYVRKGKNELCLECEYDRRHPGLEPVYLVGDFGVRVNREKTVIIAISDALEIGDWCKQGLPFYSGSVGYMKKVRFSFEKGQRLFVRVGKYEGVGIRVLVNGRIAGTRGWPPYEVDISDHVDAEKFDLCIEVLGHRRNSHGPLHYFVKYPEWTGPVQFVSRGDRWTDSYNLVPCGLLQSPELVIKEPA